MKNKILINQKALRGEDGYSTFSIRIKDETADKLNKLAADSNRSRNDVINILLEKSVDNCEVIYQQETI